jgi:hypothetical protein
VNDEVEILWKEMVVAKLHELILNFRGGVEENHEKSQRK